MENLALFTTEGLLFVLRWIHFLAGITWIGLLYYFNFVQVPFFAETEAPVRSGAIQKLVPRALWWFRWGAMFTFLSGLAIILIRLHREGKEGGMVAVMDLVAGNWGVAIQLGGLLGTLMFANVWLVIWPNQKIVIASAEAVAKGGQADPNAAGAGARAFLASRTNTLFSIPMLFFMGAASHLTILQAPSESPWKGIGIAVVLMAAIELNALFGKKNEGFGKLLEKHVSVIHVGLLLTGLLYVISEVLV